MVLYVLLHVMIHVSRFTFNDFRYNENVHDQTPLSPIATKIAAINRQAEERDAQSRANAKKIPYVDVRKVPVSVDAVKLIPKEDAIAAVMAAIEEKDTEVAVAVYDSANPKVIEVVKNLNHNGKQVKLFLASRSSIVEAQRLYDFVPASVGTITGKLTLAQEKKQKIESFVKTFTSAKKYFESLDFIKTSTTEVFDDFLLGALANNASDIHFEAEEKVGKVRYRIDGLLHDVCTVIPPIAYRNLLSRIKLLSGLKINIRDEAQDGRFTIQTETKDIEMRVSIIPGQFGEVVVMRILDPDSLVVDLTGLGLRPDDLELIKKDLQRPNGLILNTGPTGSGKTTTLYAFLRSVANSENKVITVEDPIEYRITGISQTQVDTESGYTFASGLRSILRQDPDVILVGEIRDEETADIAMQASLTGHLVFSTLHTNDSIGAIPRLVDLGVRSATIGPAVAVVIAQRLVRTLCPTCKKAVPVSAQLLTNIQHMLQGLPERVDKKLYAAFMSPEAATPPVVYEPVGCDECGGFGYKGRRAIFEFFRVNSELEEAILRSASEVTVREIARKQKMVTMQQDGILKVLVGLTSMSEVEEITGALAWENAEKAG